MKPFIVAAGFALLCALRPGDLPAQQPSAPKAPAEPVRIALLVDEIRASPQLPRDRLPSASGISRATALS